MPLDDMLKVLEEDGERQRAAVKQKAKKEVEQILAAAREEGEQIKKEQIEETLTPLSKETARILNEAKLAVKKRLAETKTDILAKVDEEAREKLEKLRASQQWAEILKLLLAEVSERVSGKIVVKVDRRDEDLARSILKGISVPYQLEIDSTLVGGVTVTSEDGRIALVNTFESRLERASWFLRPAITSILFGDGDGSRL